MNIDVNPLYEPIFTSKARYFHLWGGRSRGGSHFATDYFLWKLTQPTYFRGAMLRATMAEITQSLWIALQKRIQTACDNGDIEEKDVKINLSEHTVTYLPTKNQIICKGFRKTVSSSGANLKGLEGITHAIVEEAEDVFQDDFMELDATFRTTEVKDIQVFVLFNPPGKNHWLIKTYYDLVPANLIDQDNKPVKGWYVALQKNIPELLSIHSTYLDNSLNVNEGTKRLYRAYGDKKSHLYNFDYYYRSVCGLVSEGKKGRIFTTVKSISRYNYDQLPFEEFCGLDFGFNDPTAMGAFKYHDGKLYGRKIIYENGLVNNELAAEMRNKGIKRTTYVYADSAEPKTIVTLQRYGFNIIPAIKGPDSIDFGYRELLNVQIYLVDDDENKEPWNEIEEHIWAMDKDKNPTDVPEDSHNHFIDAMRYAYTMHVSRRGKVESTRADELHIDSIRGGEKISKEELLNSLDLERQESISPLDDEDEDDFYESMGQGYDKRER